MLLQRIGTVVALLAALSLAGVADTHAQGDPVQLVVQETTFEYAGEGEIVVEISLLHATGVAGIDFVITFPDDRFSDGPVWESAGLFGFVQANTTVPGQVAVAAILAEGLTVDSGLVGTLTFTAPCAGNAQDWPEGRPVDFAFTELRAYDETPAEMASQAVDGAIVLHCISTAAEDASFGVLKARFGGE